MTRKQETSSLASTYRSYGTQYYHMVFDKIENGQLFDDDEDFAEGMNAVAIEQFINSVLIECFVLMINHAHFLVYCNGIQALSFFYGIKKRLNSMLLRNGKMLLGPNYFFKLIPIENQDQRIATAVYIARNPYKARKDVVPGGYLWGSTSLMFSEVSKLITSVPLSDLSKRQKRDCFKSGVSLPDDYRFHTGMKFILPQSYVKQEYLISVIGNAQNYCHALLRNNDAYVKIAEGIGESVELDDNELNYILWNIAKNQYSVGSVAELGMNDRLSVANTLRRKYHVDIKRICRKLSLPLKTVQDLFA